MFVCVFGVIVVGLWGIELDFDGFDMVYFGFGWYVGWWGVGDYVLYYWFVDFFGVVGYVLWFCDFGVGDCGDYL